MNRQTLLQLALMTAAATAMYLWGHRIALYVLSGLIAMTVLLALVSPDTLHTLQALIDRVGAWVFTGLGLVLLTLVYYLIFVPGSLLLRLRGVDPLNRKFPCPGQTNWIERIGYGADPTLYEKLYTRPHEGSPPPGGSA